MTVEGRTYLSGPSQMCSMHTNNIIVTYGMYRNVKASPTVRHHHNHLHVPKDSWQLVARFYHTQGMLQLQVPDQSPYPPTDPANNNISF